ncbi:hypothetical protein AAY473_036960 [Plecturocebus cupreus]
MEGSGAWKRAFAALGHQRELRRDSGVVRVPQGLAVVGCQEVRSCGVEGKGEGNFGSKVVQRGPGFFDSHGTVLCRIGVVAWLAEMPVIMMAATAAWSSCCHAGCSVADTARAACSMDPTEARDR